MGTLKFVIFVMLFLVACGGTDSSGNSSRLDPDSDAGRGEILFKTHCATCHAIKGDRVIVGPSLDKIALRAGQRVEGLDTQGYLQESILSPDSYVVEGFVQGSMPQTFATQLTTEQVDRLIAYLLTLR